MSSRAATRRRWIGASQPARARQTSYPPARALTLIAAGALVTALSMAATASFTPAAAQYGWPYGYADHGDIQPDIRYIRPSPRPSSSARPRTVGARAPAALRILVRPKGARPIPVAGSGTPPKRRAGPAALPRVSAGQTMCVRLCDGYPFPVGRLRGKGDLAAHEQACQALCPATPTRLYQGRVDEPGGARSLSDGTPYRQLKTALLFQRHTVPSCGCQASGQIATPLPIRLDPTLRPGDVIVEESGEPKVFAGSGRLPHPPGAFASLRVTPLPGRAVRAEIERVVGRARPTMTARAGNRQASAGPEGLRDLSAPSSSGTGVRMHQLRERDDGPVVAPARIILIR